MSTELTASLEENIINIRRTMNNSSDLNIKHARAGGIPIAAIFCEGLASTDTMANLIFRPINSIGNDKKLSVDAVRMLIHDGLLLAGEQKQVTDVEKLAHGIMSGFVAVLIDGVDHGIIIGVQGYAARSVEEPSTHHNLRSSHEGFVEVLRTNLSLVRRRMKTPDLVFEIKTLGDVSNTDVCLCFIKGRADVTLVDEIRRRLDEIPLDVIIEGGYIQPFLEKGPTTLYSEIGTTERPDDFAAKLYGGSVGIIVDGTPFALVLPYLFVENFHTMDDYTSRPAYTAFNRILRYIAFFTGTMLSGVYVALANFNPELFPNLLLLNLATSIEQTPFNLLSECIIIHIFYEIMRKAGLRMPTHLGHTISIVGGIVIGDIIVSAGLVGAPLVLIVAVSSITSFMVPDLYESMIIIRFVFIIAGGLWGLYGLTVVGMLFLFKVCSLSSYGVPNTAPISPFSLKSMRDVFIRLSWRGLAKSDNKVQNMNGVTIHHE